MTEQEPENPDIVEAKRSLKWAESWLREAEDELDEARRLVAIFRRDLRDLERNVKDVAP